ncbi:MAG: hypothetical protein H7832_14420 [Magnetococcus sp. DMHC-6]
MSTCLTQDCLIKQKNIKIFDIVNIIIINILYMVTNSQKEVVHAHCLFGFLHDSGGISMKKMLMGATLGLALFVSQGSAFAGPTGDAIKAGLGEARENLMGLIAASDPATQAQKQEGIKMATAKVNEAIASSSDPAIAEKVAEFKKIWTDFTTTRDTEIIPDVLAGKKEEAKKLAEGVQAERLKKMKELLQGM